MLRADEKFMVRLRFSRDELLYDIKNCAFAEGEVLGEEQQHAHHTLVDIGEEGNVDRMTRIFGLCHAKCIEVLYPLTKHEVVVSEDGVPLNDRLDERSEYNIDLLLDRGWSRTTVNLLEHEIHEYMVCCAVADWLSITNPEKSELWAKKGESALQEIRNAKSHRFRPKRRRMSPF